MRDRWTHGRRRIDGPGLARLLPTLTTWHAIAFLLILPAMQFLWLMNRLRGYERLGSHSLRKESSRMSSAVAAKADKFIDLQGKVCFGCVHAVVSSTGRTCGEYLLLYAEPSAPQSLMDLARQHEECQRCHPDSCAPREKIYHRYDHVSPEISGSFTVNLRSLPEAHRLPLEASRDGIKSFLQDPKHRYPHREYLFSYNPSIIQLPVGRQLEDAVYLTSFRVSNQNFCFHPDDRIQMMGQAPVKPINYLKLALLRSDFSIVEDLIVDASAVLERVEDFRLFVLAEKVYVSTSDHISEIVWGGNMKGNTLSSSTDTTKALSAVFPNQTSASPRLFDNIAIRGPSACAPCGRMGPCAKNLNYFAVGLKIYAEIWPSSPRKVRGVNLQAPCERKSPSQDVDSSLEGPIRSFGTLEEVLYPIINKKQRVLTRGRGGACCVELALQGNKTQVLVGVAHVKTPSQGNKRTTVPNLTENHYLSFFYAFKKEHPFEMVAQSGYFCLGFSDPSEDPVFTPLTEWRKLTISNEVFACPRVHFVSGIAVDADDPEKIILAYGVNDCTSRFVQICRTSIQRLLFPRD